MTGKDVLRLEEARDSIPPGTRINITFLAGEDLGMRLTAAREVKRLGFVPVAHLAARRLPSRSALEEFLSGLAADGTAGNVFVVGGDPARPEGPYPDALAVLRTGLLQRHGVRHIGISGYPDGHPAIAGPDLWTALADKAAAIAAEGFTGDVITQFGFDAVPVLDWLEAVRARGVQLPVRIGVPGPAGARRLLGYATRFGVATGASVARKYGFSLTNLMATTGPDRFLQALADRYDPARHGTVKVHFYTFGGLRTTAEWATRFRRQGSIPQTRAAWQEGLPQHSRA
ncbi:5,10-methylenetetrahydrofolate reductase [Streptomyces pluripotens]|uniref:5,10-methylenetetrahydrofolate reductase n=1 Tax=Streptomyces pluripotens TaxID=1355015 RepID=A0A221P942_9ACTN|nr:MULTISPECIES: 5,10-methylenetetrahydrofolate reductase [Streptomyces]ARP74484.1 5,10-methylenetetrahydrofolate reductase [Streptomyces pluripotens]ASN28761.1 5,10-methylenetetrahydrofolate reductase [Streptomyces pluripotens]MCH0558082.1 methylenetetrahydrofolate reductase [Streptomyces sp. MUM 16J]